MIRGLILGAVLVLHLLALPASAQDPVYPVAIHEGTCDGLGAVLADLAPAAVPEGDAVGAAGGITAGQSRSELPIPFDQIVDGDLVLAVGDPDDPAMGLACGPLGGVLDPSGALVVGIQPVANSGVSGVAHVDPAGIALFVVDGPTEVEPVSAPAAIQTAEPGGAAATPDRGPVEAPEPVRTSRERPAAFGETAESNGVAVSLNNGYFAEAHGLSTPKVGFKYLVFDAHIKNAGTDDHAYAPSLFSGEDLETGAGYNSVFVIADGVLGSGQLAPGQFIVGTIVLEVENTAESVVVRYDPQQFDPNDLYWIFP